VSRERIGHLPVHFDWQVEESFLFHNLHGLIDAGDGRLFVLPWSPPVKGSLQYAEQTACCLPTIAQFGK
jgi:hypothetical protein